VLLRGVALIAVVTAACSLLKLTSAPASLIFLVAVVIQSLDSTFAEAVVVSLLAVASLDFFLTAPPFSFSVDAPLDVITLVSYTPLLYQNALEDLADGDITVAQARASLAAQMSEQK